MLDDCSNCKYSEPAVLEGIDEEEGEEVLRLKCYRYPPTVFVDAEGELAQTVPEATHICGEFKPTSPAIKPMIA